MPFDGLIIKLRSCNQITTFQIMHKASFITASYFANFELATILKESNKELIELINYPNLNHEK